MLNAYLLRFLAKSGGAFNFEVKTALFTSQVYIEQIPTVRLLSFGSESIACQCEMRCIDEPKLTRGDVSIEPSMPSNLAIARQLD